MAPLLQELSTLEVEPLEVIVNAPKSEQDSSLDTLTIVQGDLDLVALLKGKGAFPANDTKCCCLVCCPCCCCFCA